MTDDHTPYPTPNMSAGEDCPSNDALSMQDMLDYLKAHPEFLRNHPEIFAHALPPEQTEPSDNIYDFQQFAIKSLQRLVADHAQETTHIARMARDQQELLYPVQQAVIQLVALSSLERFFEFLCVDLAHICVIDVVRLGLESLMAGHYESFYPEDVYSGMVFMTPDACRGLFTSNTPVTLVADSALDHPWLGDLLFHECRDLAESCAYMLLDLPQAERKAVLAFGCRDKGRFQPGQNSEALAFLSRVMGIKLDQLLYHQAGLI